jgi:hypothetical protein
MRSREHWGRNAEILGNDTNKEKGKEGVELNTWMSGGQSKSKNWQTPRICREISNLYWGPGSHRKRDVKVEAAEQQRVLIQLIPFPNRGAESATGLNLILRYLRTFRSLFSTIARLILQTQIIWSDKFISSLSI